MKEVIITNIQPNDILHENLNNSHIIGCYDKNKKSIGTIKRIFEDKYIVSYIKSNNYLLPAPYNSIQELVEDNSISHLFFVFQNPLEFLLWATNILNK